MKTTSLYIFAIALLTFGCSRKEQTAVAPENLAPRVSNDGSKITFPTAESCAFFATEAIGSSAMNAEITAPAKVSATVINSDEGASHIILFENPDLAGSYTQLIQHLININQIQNISIRQKRIELDRMKDLQQHGAATGKDLLEAQTLLAMEEMHLANEKAAIIEHETKLKAGGFEPEMLRKAKAGTAYVICDIPENQINRITKGGQCILTFTAFPNEKFTGKIEEVADMVDNVTRMIKLRVSINNAGEKLKAGMFATVSFGISEGNALSVSKNSLITIQGENYVFVKKGNTTFERRKVITGDQIGDRIVVFSGLENNDAVASKGVMQLKGLSFGY